MTSTGLTRRVRLSVPDLPEGTEELVLGVLRSGQLAQGPVVAWFEQLCARMAGTTHAVAVSNGTASLEVALEALQIGPGDEVITSPFTFAATLNAILRAGARARFADITADFTIDPGSVRALVGPRTKVLLPVHLYGLCADMPSLAATADEFGLAIVEDAAQAHGAIVAGRRAGSFGLGSFSFYATKNICAGEGGVVTTDDDELARRVRMLRNQGMQNRYQYEYVGRNLRLTDLQAAVAVPQLERLDQIVVRRNENARTLTAALLERGTPVQVPAVPKDRTHVWHQYTVLLPAGVDREAVVARLASAGVDSGVYYPRPVWDYPVYRDHPGVAATDRTPVAEDVAARCLSLPVHQQLDDDDLESVAATLDAALRG